MRSRVRATGGGRRERSVMTSGIAAGGGAKWPVGLSGAVCASAPALARSVSTSRKPKRNMGGPPFSGPPPVYQKRGIAGERRAERGGSRLLPDRGCEGEFAVADAQGKTLGETRGGFLAEGRDEFGEGGEQAGLRQAIAVDALDARLDPRRVQIAERRPLLLMLRSLTRSFDRSCCHCRCRIVAGLQGGGTLAWGLRAPRATLRNG